MPSKGTYFGLRNIRKISTCFNEVSQEIIKLNDIDFINNIKIETKFDIKILMEEHLTFFVNVIYEYRNNDINFTLFELKYAFDFYLDNFETVIKKKDKNIDISSNLLNSLFTISYSTTRGIIFSETKGTYLEGLYLPIIDTHKYIENRFKDYIVKEAKKK